MSLCTSGVVLAARRVKARNFGELATALGTTWTPEFEKEARKVAPGVKDFLDSRAFGAMRRGADERGDIDQAKEWGEKSMWASMASLDHKHWVPGWKEEVKLAAKVKDPVKVVRKRAPGKRKKPEVARPVKDGEVESPPLRKLVLGYVDREYMGRPVAVVRLPTGLFGARDGRERFEEMTLVNGLLNHCACRSDPPTPYWAVMDAASSLKDGFSKEEVVALALERFPWADESLIPEDKKKRTLRQLQEDRCEISWEVLKGHHIHPRKKDAGMSHMVDPGGSGKFSVRGRDEHETLKYFEDSSTRRKRWGSGERRQRRKKKVERAPGKVLANTV